MKKTILLVVFFLSSTLYFFSQTTIYNIRYSQHNQKKIFNIGLFGILSTNGEDSENITNNLSIGIIHTYSDHIRGLSIAPFNHVFSTMHGLQLGLINSTNKEVRGVQLGFANQTAILSGLQIGFGNELKAEKSQGIQIGMLNFQKQGALQIGIFNHAEHNDCPIGFVNIIKDGQQEYGITIDEMTNLMAIARTGGKYTYGIVGAGYSFGSPHNQMIVELGLGARMHLSNRFKIDTEISMAALTQPKLETQRKKEEREKRGEELNFYSAQKFTLRILPNLKIGNRIRISAGPTLNYMYTHQASNEKLFPSQHLWRKFEGNNLKQLHIGWNLGVYYCLK